MEHGTVPEHSDQGTGKVRTRTIRPPYQVVKGRNGWRFILRDPGQTVTIKSYAPVEHKMPLRYKNYSEMRKKHMKHALQCLHAGGFIRGEIFIWLCKEHGVHINRWVYAQLLYINRIEVSVLTIRHKNERADFQRQSFRGMFSTIEYLIAKTIDLANTTPL